MSLLLHLLGEEEVEVLLDDLDVDEEEVLGDGLEEFLGLKGVWVRFLFEDVLNVVEFTSMVVSWSVE